MDGAGASDARALCDVVAELHEDRGPEPIPMTVLRRLQELLGADSAAGYVDCPRGRAAKEWVTRPAPAWLPAALHEVGEQDPVHRVHCRDFHRPVAISDRLSQAEFRRRDIYTVVCEPLGVGDSMRLYLPSDGNGRFLFFDRSTYGFPERARLILEVLRPHLAAACLRRAPRPKPPTHPGLTVRQTEILRLVARGLRNADIARELFLSEGTIRTHLEHAYQRIGVHSRTAAVAALAPSSLQVEDFQRVVDPRTSSPRSSS